MKPSLRPLLFLWCCAAVACSDTRRTTAVGTDPSTSEGNPDGSVPVAVVGIGGVQTTVGTTCPLTPDASTPNETFFGLRPSPIAAENAKPGDSDWALRSYNRNLAGYTEKTSYAPGDTVKVHLAYSSGTSVSWTLYRVGYYGGKLARKILSGGPVSVSAAPAPVMDSTNGAVRANYPVAISFELPDDAVTGAYLLKFDSPVGDSRVLFVVREKTYRAVALMPLPVNTYQAYNLWGGTSLYGNIRSDWPASHAYAVSFDRPYLLDNGLGEFDSQDRPFILFAESQGYDLGYATDEDLDGDSTLLLGRRLVVIQGHSEYWTRGMRDAVEAAIARGSNVVFFGANTSYWQVRYQQRSTGERQMVGYKDYASRDPILATDPTLVTDQWRRAPINRPENAMIGSMFGEWIWSGAPLVVRDASCWIWTGTGVTNGTIFPGLYGDETDQRYANGWEPAGVQTVGDGWMESYGGGHGRGQTTLYSAPSGATVFNAASIVWSQALFNGDSSDVRIQQVVANLFSKLAGNGALGPGAFTGAPPTPSSRNYNWISGSTVKTIATGLSEPSAIAIGPDGGTLVAEGNRILQVKSDGTKSVFAGDMSEGDDDGPAQSARFAGPRGIAIAPDGDVFVADTGNSRIRRISQGNVTTLAGSVAGFADGVGSSAKFQLPMAVAISPSGSVLVADTFNQRIREVKRDGTASTIAGNGALGPADGSGTKAVLAYPFSITVTSDGQAAIIAEPSTGVLRQVRLAPSHDVTAVGGVPLSFGWSDGPLSSATASETWAVVGAPNGDLILLDSASARVRRIHSGAIETIAGGARGDLADGPGSQAGFAAPRAAAFAPDGSLWVVDAALGAVRRITF